MSQVKVILPEIHECNLNLFKKGKLRGLYTHRERACKDEAGITVMSLPCQNLEMKLKTDSLFLLIFIRKYPYM